MAQSTYSRWLEEHKKDLNRVTLFEAGDFYETYDIDATVCHEVLKLQLTKTSNGSCLTGFPKHALKTYLLLLVTKTRPVQVIEKNRKALFFCNDRGELAFKETKTTVNNNQTTTTMEKKKFYTIGGGLHYMFNQEMQCLVEIKPLREVFFLKSGKAIQEWRVANTDKVMKTRYTPATDEEPKQFDGEMYHTFEDFEKGKAMTIDELLYNHSTECDICKGLMKGPRDINIDEKGAYIWTIENGQAVKWYFIDHIKKVTWEYDEEGYISVKSDYDGGELPEAYSSSEEVYKYNDYRFVDANGNEEVREGVYSRLKLDDDQKLLANKLQQVLEECKAAGMKVYFSTTSYDLRAVNQRNVERIGYDPEFDEETEQEFVFDDRRVSHVFKGVYDLNSEDSDMKFVIKK